MLILRLIHILGGVIWVGAMTFTTFFLFPIFRGDPATAGKVMQGLMQRRFMQIMPVIALLTIISGLWMLSIAGGPAMGAYMRSNAGRTFSMSGGVAILAFLLGIFLGRPAGMRAAALGAQMSSVTDPAERTKLQAQMAALQKKSGLITVLVTSFLLISAAGMAVARYL